MITLQIDTILKAVVIDDRIRYRLYTPSPASIRRVERLTQSRCWVFIPSPDQFTLTWVGPVEVRNG